MLQFRTAWLAWYSRSAAGGHGVQAHHSFAMFDHDHQIKISER